MKLPLVAPPLVLAASLLAPPVAAQCDWQSLASSIIYHGDDFGFAVDLQGTRLLVGAPSRYHGLYKRGFAFVFELAGGQWVQTAMVWGSHGDKGDRFGDVVALDGDTLMIGATYEPAVYFFEKQGSGWAETARVAGPNEYADSLGKAIALQGNTALLGVDRYGTPSHECGAVLVMERTGSSWNRSQILQASDVMYDGSFGSSVDLDGDVAAVCGAGKVYVFERTPQGFVEVDSFGGFYSAGPGLSISDDLIFVGDIYNREAALSAGAVHVLQRIGGQWVKVQKLTASDAQDHDHFGLAISVSGSRALVGMPHDGAHDKGAAYLFELGPSGWTEAAKLLSPDHWKKANYGMTVAIDEQGMAIVGAPSSVWAPEGDPRAYTYVFDGPDCNSNGVPDFCDLAAGTSQDEDDNGVPDECTCDMARYCVATPNSTGSASAIGAQGPPSVLTNAWSVQAAFCPPGQFGLFFYGQQQKRVPFGDGWRCVGGQAFRLPVVQIMPSGEAVWYVDFTNPPVPAGQITPGSTWNFQFLYHDPAAGGSGFNLSDGLSVNFCL